MYKLQKPVQGVPTSKSTNTERPCPPIPPTGPRKQSGPTAPQVTVPIQHGVENEEVYEVPEEKNQVRKSIDFFQY